MLESLQDFNLEIKTVNLVRGSITATKITRMLSGVERLLLHEYLQLPVFEVFQIIGGMLDHSREMEENTCQNLVFASLFS